MRHVEWKQIEDGVGKFLRKRVQQVVLLPDQRVPVRCSIIKAFRGLELEGKNARPCDL
jgi:hypothetical protein